VGRGTLKSLYRARSKHAMPLKRTCGATLSSFCLRKLLLPSCKSSVLRQCSTRVWTSLSAELHLENARWHDAVFTLRLQPYRTFLAVSFFDKLLYSDKMCAVPRRQNNFGKNSLIGFANTGHKRFKPSQRRVTFRYFLWLCIVNR